MIFSQLPKHSYLHVEKENNTCTPIQLSPVKSLQEPEIFLLCDTSGLTSGHRLSVLRIKSELLKPHELHVLPDRKRQALCTPISDVHLSKCIYKLFALPVPLNDTWGNRGELSGETNANGSLGNVKHDSSRHLMGRAVWSIWSAAAHMIAGEGRLDLKVKRRSTASTNGKVYGVTPKKKKKSNGIYKNVTTKIWTSLPGCISQDRLSP